MQRHLRILGIAALALATQSAKAGLYSDEMARCLVASTSASDKTNLVRWIFANAALHPDVANIAVTTAEQRTSMNRATGEMIERLLTVACRKQTGEALRYEGAAAIQTSFQVLGQVAMGTLMSHPAVAQGFGELSKFVDQGKIDALKSPSD